MMDQRAHLPVQLYMLFTNSLSIKLRPVLGCTMRPCASGLVAESVVSPDFEKACK